MADTRMRSTKTVSFPEADTSEERIAAVLINRAADGTLRAYVKDVPGRNQPIPEAVEVLIQAVDLANL